MLPALKGLVQRHAAYARSQRGLGQLDSALHIVGDTVGGFLRIHDLHVDDTVDGNGHVVRGYAGLGRHVKHSFLQ